MGFRRVITRSSAVLGIVAAGVGLLIAWQSEDFFVGSVWMVLGVGLMAASIVYSLAMDEHASRSKSAETLIDVRQRVAAATSPGKSDSTRVSV